MAKAKWGTKCLCRSCGARFYDLKRKQVVCPKCGAPYQAETPAKPRRSAPAEAAPAKAAPVDAAPAEAAPTKAAPAEAAPDTAGDKPDTPVAAEGGGLETTDDDEDDAEAGTIIEDASELGEDEDDVAEVVDSSRKGGET